VGDICGYRGYPCISISAYVAFIAEPDEKQHFLAHECKSGKWHMLGRAIRNDTYIPIYLPILGSIGNRDGEYLHLLLLAEV
jgi:hypothetical protein